MPGPGYEVPSQRDYQDYLRRTLTSILNSAPGSEVYTQYLSGYSPEDLAILRAYAPAALTPGAISDLYSYPEYKAYANASVSDQLRGMGSGPDTGQLSMYLSRLLEQARSVYDAAKQVVPGLTPDAVYALYHDYLWQDMPNGIRRYTGGQGSFGDWLAANLPNLQLRYGVGLSPDQVVENWLNQSPFLSAQQRSYFEQISDDLYNYYNQIRMQGRQDVPGTFSEFLAMIGDPLNLFKDTYVKGGKVLMEAPWADFQAASDAAPQEFFLEWVNNLEGLSPEVKNRLAQQFDDILARYGVIKNANPFAFGSFADYLTTLDPQAELARMPEADTAEQFADWVRQLPGLTPVQRQALEARYFPTYAQWLMLRNSVSPDLSFAEFLASTDPMALLSQLPQFSPLSPGSAGANIFPFSRRVRWFGY